MCATVDTVRSRDPDLSARQMAVLLAAYLDAGRSTVRELAVRLKISKPAVSRAIDRLEELDLVRRRPDERDRRSVVLARTVRGSVFLSELGERISAAAADLAAERADPATGTGGG